MKLNTLLLYPLIIVTILVGFTTRLKAQTIPAEGVEITKAIPASPDAAALGKYGSIPVSPYTGVPNISIPIYTIKSGSISLPISLSYHAGGNKVEEMASSVGLGWVLNSGGAITRTIRGKADEETLGFLDQCQCVPNILGTIHGGGNLSNQTLNEYLNQISDGTMDGEADIYNFNFAGYSGRFVMDTHGNVTTIPQQRIKFTFTINQSGPDGVRIQSFTAITPDGLTYVFGSDNDLNDAVEETYAASSCAIPSPKNYYATSWFIKKITDPTGHEIDFNYNLENSQIGQSRTQSIFQLYDSGSWYTTFGQQPIPVIPPTDCFSSSLVYGVKLSSIIFENGQFNVFAGTLRNDMSNSKLIDSVSITSNGFSKKYHLYYTNNTTSRLRLDSVITQLETIAPNNYKKERYSFQYNPDTWIPHSLFYQDYWGYNNGHTENNSLVPGATFTYMGTNNSIWLDGADRNSDEQAMIAGMLTRITYPTGGYTVFNYEANHEYNTDLGGTSTSYTTPMLTAAKSNDPNSGYYNYDSNNGNPNDLLTIVNPSGAQVAVGIGGWGFHNPLDNPGDPNYGNFITSYLEPVDSLGNQITSLASTAINNIDTTLYLLPGRYKIVVADPKNQSGTYLYTAVVTWHNQNTGINSLYKNYIVGGLRIRQIADYDGINSTPVNLKTYAYTLPGQTYSSGWVDYKPIYNYYMKIGAGSAGGGYFPITYFVRAAVSNYPLSTTQGSVVGYSHVVEINGANGQNGKTEYYYTNSQTDPDLPSGVQLNTAAGSDNTGFPFSPMMSHDWRRGLLLRQTTWKSTGSTYAKVQDKVNSYGSTYLGFMNNLKVGFTYKPKDYNEILTYFNNNVGEGIMSVFNYADYTDFTYLVNETTTDYSLNDTTKFVQTTTNFQMDSTSLLVSKLTSNNSKNERITQTVTYPGNYTSFAGSSIPGVSLLQNLHILSYPIEEVTQKSDTMGNNLRTVKAILTTYKPSQPLRDSVYEMRSVSPVTGFVSSLTGAKDSHYQPVVSFDKYDAKGNILQERQVGGALHSYIWGYYNANSPRYETYPIAEVINADASSIAYTNFESYDVSGYGNWTYSNAANTTDATAPMGAQCFNVSSSNTLVKSGLTSAASYVVSFWYKSGAAVTVNGGTVTFIATGNAKSGWLYHEYKVTGTTTVTIGGTGLIDELRLYPVNAQMSTYTYTRLVGMSSKCDTKNDITYYVYDNVGRLQQVQDQNRNILKDYLYNYVSYSPVWTDNGNTYCVQGPYGNTGEQMMQQTDKDPYSATYMQTRYRSLGVTGNCPLPPGMYVTLRVTSTTTTTVKGYPQTNYTYEADVYSDAGCTTRMNVLSALPVNYTIAATTTFGNGNPTTTNTNTYTVTVPAGASSVVVGTIDVSGCSSPDGVNTNCTTSVVTPAAGANYTPVTNGGN